MSRVLPRLALWFRRYRAREDGNITVEFVLLFPLLLVILFSSVELGMILLRQVMLDRAVDMTVRDIRLSTGGQQDPEDLRTAICTRSAFVENCADSLRLEMVRIDPFLNDINISDAPQCIDKVEEANPATLSTLQSFNGESNDLMYIRACQSFKPVFPYWGLAASMKKQDGRIQIFASSAFVQEPK